MSKRGVLNFADCDPCDSTSDNRSFNCPARMADGRHFTDYRPRCAQHFRDVGDNEKFVTSFDRRQYLIHNAEEIMVMNAKRAQKLNACGPCVAPYNRGTMLPEQSIQKCDKRGCSFKLDEPQGLGLGRDYGELPEVTQARVSFLERKVAEQREMADSRRCCSKPVDDVAYYPLDGRMPERSRLAVTGSGRPLDGGDRILP